MTNVIIMLILFRVKARQYDPSSNEWRCPEIFLQPHDIRRILLYQCNARRFRVEWISLNITNNLQYICRTDRHCEIIWSVFLTCKYHLKHFQGVAVGNVLVYYRKWVVSISAPDKNPIDHSPGRLATANKPVSSLLNNTCLLGRSEPALNCSANISVGKYIKTRTTSKWRLVQINRRTDLSIL